MSKIEVNININLNLTEFMKRIAKKVKKGVVREEDIINTVLDTISNEKQ